MLYLLVLPPLAIVFDHEAIDVSHTHCCVQVGLIEQRLALVNTSLRVTLIHPVGRGGVGGGVGEGEGWSGGRDGEGWGWGRGGDGVGEGEGWVKGRDGGGVQGVKEW